jgi:CRP/FNR family transcriptional regulator
MVKLCDIPMFSVLNKDYLKELQNAIHIKNYTKDSILFYEGGKSDYLYILLDGDVKLYKTSPKGSQIQINRLSAPSLIAEVVCLEKKVYPVTCAFTNDGAVGLLHYDKLYECLSQPDFSLKFIKSLASKVMILSALIHRETILSSEAKVADLMIKKSAIFNHLKYNEIASILNLTPETFSRILTKFKKKSIICMDGHHLKILNEDALFSILETNTTNECTNCTEEIN